MEKCQFQILFAKAKLYKFKIIKMNIFQDLELNTEKAAVLSIKKTEKSQMMAIGLGKAAILKKHKTGFPANLIVIKGSIAFKINDETHQFVAGEVFEIPVDVEHEVTGLEEENYFVLTKEL